MEGDAGTSRLNPNATDSSSSSKVESQDSPSEVKAEDSSESEVGTDQTSTEVTAEDSSESEVGTDQTSAEVKAEDSSESEGGTDQTSTEVAGEELSSEETAEDAAESEDGDSPQVESNPSRLGRGWFVALIATLLVLAGGLGTAGYFALRANKESRTLAQDSEAAVQAAKDCVAATQAPDIAAMVASQQKIIDCATGDFRAQAVLYSSLLIDAYQAANAHVQVSDMRAAPERSNADGSIDVLVAVRVKVTNTEAANQEAGYRLRVKMAPDEGQFRIAKLDQVAK
ncbi:hypothetical protein MSP7336_00894 [Mycobacterium shimoidei]|uniref:Mce protein n=1 Tax=Mycobacterium shimoidei TaxID=29313 RepID=A0A375YUZ4_MYCSH|nr:hypothetical protein [Mycobacterium shimoidei]SRX92668.1 hypothetical protein MSP7336_00894 [Mycobacterium shimoidei]